MDVVYLYIVRIATDVLSETAIDTGHFLCELNITETVYSFL